MYLTHMDFQDRKVISAQMRKKCVERAEEIGYPVVMKIASQDIIHKSDAGGVKVGVKNKQQVFVLVQRNNYQCKELQEGSQH